MRPVDFSSRIARCEAAYPSRVITRGVPLCRMARLKNRFAALTSRRSLNRKSTVRPYLSTARYRYVHRPLTFIYVSSQRQEPLTGRAYRFQRFSNSGTYRCTQRRIDVCAKATPRSDMIWTKSLELSLKLRYHLTQRTMISRSKCRPLNRSTAAGRLVIRRLWQATTFSAFCTRTPTTAVPAEIQEAQLQFENWSVVDAFRRIFG